MESLLITANIMTIKSLTLIEKLILTDIKRLSAMTGDCKKPDTRWSYDFGVGLATVSRAVKKLEDLGLIKRDSVKCQGGTDRKITLNEEDLKAFLKKHRVGEYRDKKSPVAKARKQAKEKREEQLDLVEQQAKTEEIEQSEPSHQHSEGDIVFKGEGFNDYYMASKWRLFQVYELVTGEKAGSKLSVGAGGCGLVDSAGAALADIIPLEGDQYSLRVYDRQPEPELEPVATPEFIDYEIIPDDEPLSDTPQNDVIDFDQTAHELIEDEDDDDLDFFIEKWRTE